jgi:hypothetical protein
MTEAAISFAGNLTDDAELRHTEGGIARAMFRGGVGSAGAGGVVLHRGRVARPGRSTVEVVAEELGPSLRWATATTTRITRSQ